MLIAPKKRQSNPNLPDTRLDAKYIFYPCSHMLHQLRIAVDQFKIDGPKGPQRYAVTAHGVGSGRSTALTRLTRTQKKRKNVYLSLIPTHPAVREFPLDERAYFTIFGAQ